MYDGTVNGANPGQWCDYDDIKVEELGISEIKQEWSVQNELVRISSRESQLNVDRPEQQKQYDTNQSICEGGIAGLHGYSTTSAKQRVVQRHCDWRDDALKALNEIDAELEQLELQKITLEDMGRGGRIRTLPKPTRRRR